MTLRIIKYIQNPNLDLHKYMGVNLKIRLFFFIREKVDFFLGVSSVMCCVLRPLIRFYQQRQ